MIAILFASCEDEDKNPLNLLELDDSKAPFVRIIVDEPIVAAGDIAASSLVAKVDALENNVASWQLAVSRESGGVASDTIVLTTLTDFPSQLSIPYTEIADALGISTDEISFGDGWDGAFVTFEIDGVTTDYTFTAGSAANFEVNVPEGTSSLVISYTSGAFEEEHIYTIETPDGDVRGPFGPNPAPCIN